MNQNPTKSIFRLTQYIGQSIELENENRKNTKKSTNRNAEQVGAE